MEETQLDALKDAFLKKIIPHQKEIIQFAKRIGKILVDNEPQISKVFYKLASVAKCAHVFYNETPDGQLLLLYSEYTKAKTETEKIHIANEMLSNLGINKKHWKEQYKLKEKKIVYVFIQVMEKSTKKITENNGGAPDPAWLILAWDNWEPGDNDYHQREGMGTKNRVGWNYLRTALINELNGQYKLYNKKQKKLIAPQIVPIINPKSIKLFCKRSDISMSKLARKMGVSPSFLSQIINEKRSFPRPRQQQMNEIFLAMNPMHKSKTI